MGHSERSTVERHRPEFANFTFTADGLSGCQSAVLSICDGKTCGGLGCGGCRDGSDSCSASNTYVSFCETNAPTVDVLTSVVVSQIRWGIANIEQPISTVCDVSARLQTSPRMQITVAVAGSVVATTRIGCGDGVCVCLPGWSGSALR